MIKRLKKNYIFGLIFTILVLSGCQNSDVVTRLKMDKYETVFYDSFDTFVQVTYYTEDEALAKDVEDYVHQRFLQLHKLYDKYDEYEGVNNVKTINDRAGVEPVQVDPDLLDLVLKSKEWYEAYSPMTDITIGPVTKIWHDYRREYEQGIDLAEDSSQIHPSTETKLPEMEDLEAAAKYMGMDKLLIDKEASTIFLAEEGMALDLGAVAKGYATELVAQEMKEMGITSALINAGGNTRIIGSPVDGRKDFLIGIQNPMVFDDSSLDNLKATLKLNDKSVVTSGDYQRYYMVDGKRYHHIINPKTIMPSDYSRSVTIITEDSGLCDFLSTAVFSMPYEEGRSFIDQLDGVDAVWIFEDGSMEYTDGLKQKLDVRG